MTQSLPPSDDLGKTINRLAATIEARRGADALESYTAQLISAGPAKCARKFGEEAVEAIVAAAAGDRDNLIGEAADVIYHLLTLLAAAGVTTSEVAAELARREGASGLAEKAARTPR